MEKKFQIKGVCESLWDKNQSFIYRFISADHDVSSADKLQPGLEDEDINDVDEVEGVVGQQPQVDVFGGLVRKRPADGDQPYVPVPRRHHEEQPDDVDQVYGAEIHSQTSLWPSYMTEKEEPIKKPW